MTITKAELSDKLSNKFSLDKKVSIQVIDGVFEELRLFLEKGQEVKLSGFGVFSVKDKNSRPGRNPRTGEDVTISARRVVTFHPGKKLLDNINGA